MDLAFAAKMLCDLSLWFCTANYILSYFGHSDGSIPSAGIMLLCCLLCYVLRNEKLPLRLLPLPILFICSFWIRGVADVLLLVPPCLYCVWLCAQGHFTPDYSSSCGYFKVSAISMTVLLLLIIVFGGGARLEKYTLPFFIAFLFSGVAMLRLLRHDEQKRKEWRLWLVALVSMIGCCTAALFFSSEFFLQAAGTALGAAYRYVVAPILTGMSWLAAVVLWVILQGISLLIPRGSSNYDIPKLIDGDMDLELPTTTMVGAPDLVRKILIALAIICFLALAFKIFRRLATSAGRAQQGASLQEYRSAFADNIKTRRAAPAILPPRMPRDAVRWYYRRFLLRARADGLTIAPSDTCESIARAASELFDPTLISGLQEIYIIARYSPQTVTKDDARRAREICGRLKHKHNDHL